MRPHVIALLVFIGATSLFAQPVITGIWPSEGPTSGGTEVTITGSGFDIGTNGAAPPAVYFSDGGYFDDLRARSERVVNETTIVATTPARFSGTVSVKVVQVNGRAVANSVFKYVGDDNDAVERFLLPVFARPVPGAYGSEFRSELRLWNPSRWSAGFAGLPPSGVICSAVGCLSDYALGPGETMSRPGDGRPGRFIGVTKDAAEMIAMNLRAYDTSRSSTNFGTEIPVVPMRAFRETITLTGIPTDARFRLMLRVYAPAQSGGSVAMSFAGEMRTLQLRSSIGPSDPSYAEATLTNPAGVSSANLRLDSLPATADMPPTPIWAFVTVTNNETQHITTITPQPRR